MKELVGLSSRQKNKVLLIAAHTDDCEIAMGGTISKMIDFGMEIKYVAFAKPPEVDEDTACEEFKNACDELCISDRFYGNFTEHHLMRDRQDVLQALYDIGKNGNFDFVFCPCGDDIHQDHKAVHDECIRVFKRTTILGYEMPWNNFKSGNGMYVVLDDGYVRTKEMAIACYKTQASRSFLLNDYWKTVMEFRGGQIEQRYAEFFELIRGVWN